MRYGNRLVDSAIKNKNRESSHEVKSLCDFDESGSKYIPSSGDSAPIIGFVSVFIDESDEEIILLSPGNTNELCNEIFDENDDTEVNEETPSMFNTNNDMNEIISFSDENNYHKNLSFSGKNNDTNENLSDFNENNDVNDAQKRAQAKKKRKYKNKKTFCFYCETDVSNFSRHLFRNHGSEKEVQEILAFPKKDPLRTTSIQNLFKKTGQFHNS